MAYEIRDNSGSLFKNDKREADNHPNAQGKAMIGGVMYFVSAWTKRDKNGNPWQSLAFKPVGNEPRSEQQPKAGKTVADMDSDIPF